MRPMPTPAPRRIGIGVVSGKPTWAISCFQGRRDGSSIGTRGISPSPSASEATDEKLHLTRVVVEHGERFLPDETMNPSDLDTFAPLVVGMQRLRQIALAAHA